jgi:hypothetical protein
MILDNGFPTIDPRGNAVVRIPRDATSLAVNKYNQAARAAGLKRLLAFLTGRPQRMTSLNEQIAQKGLPSSSYAGVQAVNVNRICGSESRSEDFDREFHPVRQTTRERWIRIARAWMEEKTLPPVELIQVGRDYYVRDGHHRISVARSFGQQYIEAEIIRMQFNRTPL